MHALLSTLQGEHRRLLALAGEVEAALPPPRESALDASRRERIREPLERLILLLAEHGKRENDALFPVLQSRLPKEEHWQLRMLEIQDEAIGVEARHLFDWCASPAPPPLARVREHGARLVRWTREHVAVEEERLFPRL